MTLSAFQIESRHEVEGLLAQHNIPLNFEIISVSEDPDDPGLRFSFGDYISWIYLDGAELIAPDLDRRFEIYDFNSIDDLKRAYIRLLEEHVKNYSKTLK